ncbi:MAG: Uma2 family endonuclease [Bacteroidota bacterium]
MELKVDIQYAQLVELVRQLPLVEQRNLMVEMQQIIAQSQKSDPFDENHKLTRQHILDIAAQFPSDYHWTYDELCKHFPSDSNIPVEIIQNRLFIMPSPSEIHQELTFEICALMKSYARKHKLGKVIISPFDVIWEDGNDVAIPDVLFVSLSRQHILDGKKATDSPDLVVEVWSPSNNPQYRVEKREMYESRGVPEFWQVYPQKKRITVEVLDGKTSKYVVFSEVNQQGMIKSKVLEGFEMDVEALFEMVE